MGLWYRYRMQDIFIENCFCLTLKRVDDSLSRIRKIGDNRDYQRTDIRYEYGKEEGKDEVYFVMVTLEGHEPQKIYTDMIETSFGIRHYFFCGGCGKRCHKLHLKPGGHTFRCRKCHNIKYQAFNPSSRQGKLFLHTKKVLQLIDEQANMPSRIWWRGNFTKRYSKFLNECLKAGLTDVVKNAREIEAAISKIPE